MNPVLRALSKSGLTRLEMADLLEKHIGDGSNQHHCQSAIAALRLIKDSQAKAVTQVVARMMEHEQDPRTTVQEVIAQLRCEAWKD